MSPINPQKLESLRREAQELKKETRERTIGFIVAAFGLVAGLAWSDAVKALIEFLFPLSANNLLAKFVYAVVITLIVVLVTVYLTRFLKEKENMNSKK